MEEFKAPTTYTEATQMVAPLNPRAGKYSDEQRELAFERLIEFMALLLEDKPLTPKGE